MEDALASERALGEHPSMEERKHTANKFMKLAVAWKACEGEIPENIMHLLGEFRLSARAQKYCVGLTSQCELMYRGRKSLKESEWYVLDRLDRVPADQRQLLQHRASQTSKLCRDKFA